MHHNTYNWYSTNSYKRYQRTAPVNPGPSQYSDEGRVPLGHPDDPENKKMQEEVIASATPEELASWEAFSKKQREGSLLSRCRLGLPNEEVDEKYRTFPVKRHDWEAETNGEQQGSDASQTRNEYRSRYVLNRKVNPRPTTPSVSTATSAPPPSAANTISAPQSDEIFIDDSDRVSNSTSNSRLVVSGDKLTSEIPRITITSSSRKIVWEPANSSSPPTASATSTSSAVRRECVLAKYGHCFGPKVCEFEHDGKVLKEKNLTVKSPIWQQKLPTVQLCPGFADFSCWDNACEQRHAAYPSDNL